MLRSPQDNLSRISSGLILPEEKKLVTSLRGATIRMSGKFKITVRRNGLPHLETDWFSNLVLNQGLDGIGTANISSNIWSAPFNYCQLGTGTSTPVATQTQLDNQIANAPYSTSNGSISSPIAPNYSRTGTQNFIFAQGSVIGTVAEVGVGPVATGSLMARTLIVNGGGVPTPITLTAIDQVTVTYAVTFTVPTAPVTGGSVVLDGVTYGYTAYPHYITSSGGSNPATFGLPSGITTDWRWCGLSGSTSNFMSFYPAGTAVPSDVLTRSDIPSAGALGYSFGTSCTYAPGSYTAVSTAVIQPAWANFAGGIQGIRTFFYMGLYWGGYYYYYNFDTPIPKDNTKRLTLQFSQSWSR
jgi:hypothetical protein